MGVRERENKREREKKGRGGRKELVVGGEVLYTINISIPVSTVHRQEELISIATYMWIYIRM